MKLSLDNYERDLLIESLEYRIDSDENLILAETLKEELQDLLIKIEECEYI
jgi:hypothetical protein